MMGVDAREKHSSRKVTVRNDTTARQYIASHVSLLKTP